MQVYVISVTEIAPEGDKFYVIGATNDKSKIQEIIQEDIDIYTQDDIKYTYDDDTAYLENGIVLEYSYKLMEVE